MGMPLASIGIKPAARRAFATSSSLTRAQPISRILLERSRLQQNARRTYADVAPLKKKTKYFPFFKTLWRLTYLSVIGGTAYLAYGVYDLRNPDDQFEPDPTKKNLVILGTSTIRVNQRDANDWPSQVLDGEPYLFSKNSTPKTTMLSLFHLETTSSSLLFCHHAQPAQSSTDPSWNPSGVSPDTRRQL